MRLWSTTAKLSEKAVIKSRWRPRKSRTTDAASSDTSSSLSAKTRANTPLARDWLPGCSSPGTESWAITRRGSGSRWGPMRRASSPATGRRPVQLPAELQGRYEGQSGLCPLVLAAPFAVEPVGPPAGLFVHHGYLRVVVAEEPAPGPAQ